MKARRGISASVLMAIVALTVTACASAVSGPVGNRSVPQPAKAVDLTRYAGLWFELARYENRFERGCEGVTARYRPLPNGMIEVVNSCLEGGLGGPRKTSTGRAKVVSGSQDAKLKVSFFGPFFVGDYWVLDHADDYSWSIVGEPSGRFLWILTRQARLDPATEALVQARVKSLGYDPALIRRTAH